MYIYTYTYVIYNKHAKCTPPAMHCSPKAMASATWVPSIELKSGLRHALLTDREWRTPHPVYNQNGVRHPFVFHLHTHIYIYIYIHIYTYTCTYKHKNIRYLIVVRCSPKTVAYATCVPSIELKSGVRHALLTDRVAYATSCRRTE